MSEKTPMIMDSVGLHRTVIRLSHEIGERNEGFDSIVLVGIRRGGEIVARRIRDYIASTEGVSLPCAGLEIAPLRESDTLSLPEGVPELDVTGKTVILCDDVLHTGRSAVAGVEALFRLGRPSKVQLLVLVDRGGRELPVRADFVGKNVPTSRSEYVAVRLREMGFAEDELVITKEKRA